MYPSRSLPSPDVPQEELSHPAVAFVRVATHLLGLDGRVADQVALLRRQLLKLLHVSEFGSDAEFRELCQPFVLPDVICGWGSRGLGGVGVPEVAA